LSTSGKEDNMPVSPSIHPSLSKDEELAEFMKKFRKHVQQLPQASDENILRAIHHEMKSQPISRNASTFTEMANDRRDFIAQSLLIFVKMENSRDESRDSKLRKVLMNNPLRLTTILSLMDAFVETFGAISYNMGNSTVVAANWLLIVSFCIKFFGSLYTLRLRCRLLDQYIKTLQEVETLSKATGGTNTTDDTGHASSQRSITSTGGRNDSTMSPYLYPSPSSSAYFADEDEYFDDTIPLRRQDTEADIALVPISKRLTFKQGGE
jgi:hypothetical protein